MERALDRLVLRATLAFTVCVASIVVPILARLPEDETLVVRHVVPAYLTLDVLVHATHLVRRRFGPTPRPAAGGSPLERAWEIDRPDTRLAVLMIVLAGLASVLALVVLALPYLAEPDDRSIVIGVCLPGGLLLVFLAALAWVGEIGDLLRRALDDSAADFRAYWRGIADHS